MGRKSKRMALYEAIRQGQAKIAQGLENGQMRSDGLGRQNAQKQNAQQTEIRQKRVAQSALFESKETSGSFLSSPKIVKVALGSGAILIAILSVWLFALLSSDTNSSEPAGGQGNLETHEINYESGTDREQMAGSDDDDDDAGTGFFSSLTRKETNEEAGKEVSESRQEETTESSIGKNVIWIQRISPDRKNMLLPLKDFFDSKGIPTEVIITPDGEHAVLVTKQGFDKNPANSGTEGYNLFQKVKQLGSVYLEETGDTKWGTRPFQDIYGYKRTK